MKLLEKSVSASSVFTPRDKKQKEIRLLALQFGFSELEKPQEAFVPAEACVTVGCAVRC